MGEIVGKYWAKNGEMTMYLDSLFALSCLYHGYIKAILS